MAKTPTFSKSGAALATPAKLNSAVFEVKVANHDLLQQAYQSHLANRRQNDAKVKNRGDVRGGGKKPWAQKGTGRARFGSSRNPIWRGGGAAFGPTGHENYSLKLSLNSRRSAIRQALTTLSNDNNLVIIEAFEPKDQKTKAAAALLAKIEANGRVLIAADKITGSSVLSVQNLQNVKIINVKQLNVFDILNADKLVLTQPALDYVHDWLKPRPSAKEKGRA